MVALEEGRGTEVELEKARELAEAVRRLLSEEPRTDEELSTRDEKSLQARALEVLTRFDLQDAAILASEIEASLDQLSSSGDKLEKTERADLRELAVELGARTREIKKASEQGVVLDEEEIQATEAAEETQRGGLAVAESNRQFQAPEESIFAPLVDLLAAVQVYGSLRLRAIDRDEKTTFDENNSRFGVHGRVDLSKKVTAFGRAEVGLGLSDVIPIGGDPNRGRGDENVAIPTRLIFAGIEGDFGRLSFGKQWSTYYQVAVLTDVLPYLCCEGHGVYNAGTDGGVSGTGRASSSLQYRKGFEPYRFGLQIQSRGGSPRDAGAVDGWGASVMYSGSGGLSGGIAFNKVRDGVPNPKEGQSKEGDQIVLIGLRVQKERFYLAGTYADFEQHERDDLNRFYDGRGLVLTGFYELLDEKMWIGAAWDQVVPDREHPGKFEVQFATLSFTYAFRKHWQIWLLHRFDEGGFSDGTPSSDDTTVVSLHFTF